MAKLDKASDPVHTATAMTVGFWNIMFSGLKVGLNYMVRSHPGQAKTALSADKARQLVRDHGGIYIGPSATDFLVVDRPNAQGEPKFRLAGDKRMPVVVQGHVPVVVKYVFCPGLMSADFYGVPVPVRPYEQGLLEYDPDLRDLFPIRGKENELKVYDKLGATTELAIFSRPAIMDGIPVESKVGTVGTVIVIFDELPKTPELFPVAAGCVHNKKIGEHRFPGTSVGFLCTGNFENSGAGAHKITTDLADRMARVGVHADPETHINWLRSNPDTPPEILGFLSSSDAAKDRVYRGTMADPSDYCSPRGITDVARVVKAWWDDESVGFNPYVGVQQQVIHDRLGGTIGRDFIGFCQLGQEIPTVEEVLRDPTGLDLPRKPSACLYLSEVLAQKATADNIGKLAAFVSRMQVLPQTQFTTAVVARFEAAQDAIRAVRQDGRSPTQAQQDRLAAVQKLIAQRTHAKEWAALVTEATNSKVRLRESLGITKK